MPWNPAFDQLHYSWCLAALGLWRPGPHGKSAPGLNSAVFALSSLAVYPPFDRQTDFVIGSRLFGILSGIRSLFLHLFCCVLCFCSGLYCLEVFVGRRRITGENISPGPISLWLQLTSQSCDFPVLTGQVSIWTNSAEDHQKPAISPSVLTSGLESLPLIQRECFLCFYPAGLGGLKGYRSVAVQLKASLQVRDLKY